MGDVIRKEADPADIFTDVKTTYIRAKARKGVWEQRAEEKLGSAVNLINLIEGQLEEAQAAYAPLGENIDTIDEKADALLDVVAEDVIDLIGHPDKDPILEVIFPEQGAAYYTKGDDQEQPARMELLANLLALGLHPRLDATRAQEMAVKVREVAVEYKGALGVAAEPRARLNLLEKIRTALAQVAQISLSNLKRSYKAEGFSEAEVHNVIPNRPRPRKKAPTP